MRQNRLAKLLGLHEAMLSKVVNGYRRPSPQLRRRIASALSTSEDWLFEAAGPQPRIETPLAEAVKSALDS